MSNLSNPEMSGPQFLPAQTAEPGPETGAFSATDTRPLHFASGIDGIDNEPTPVRPTDAVPVAHRPQEGDFQSIPAIVGAFPGDIAAQINWPVPGIGGPLVPTTEAPSPNISVYVSDRDTILPLRLNAEERTTLEGGVTNELSYNTIDPPEWFPERTARAKSFIGQLLGFDTELLPEVHMVDPSVTFEERGHYNPFKHVIYVEGIDQNERRDGLTAREIERTTAHEFAHSAADQDDTALHLLLTASDAEDSSSTIEGFRVESGFTHGNNKLHFGREAGSEGREMHMKTVGALWEEALAEEAAIRYDERYGVASTHKGKRVDPLLRFIPKRFLSYDVEKDCLKLNGSASAAYTLHILDKARLLKDPNARPLFDILVETRHTDTRAEAMRTLAREVNTLQPWLYQRLNHLQYTEDDFSSAVGIALNIYARAQIAKRYDQVRPFVRRSLTAVKLRASRRRDIS